MRKIMLIGVALILIVSGLFAGVARAATMTFTGSITAATPTHNPGMLTGCLSIGGAWAYTTHTFTVSQNGSYTFTEAGAPLNAFIGLFGPSFNPALVTGAGSNCMATGRDTFTLNLSTGTTYTLVVEPTHRTATGAYSVAVSGPGNITVVAGAGAFPTPQANTGCYSDCPRINVPLGYHLVTIFDGADDQGNASLDFFCINAFGGTWGGELTRADLAGLPSPLTQNTLIKTVDSCSVGVNIYALTTGEVEINIGPIPGFKTIAIMFRGLPPENIHHYIIEPLPPD